MNGTGTKRRGVGYTIPSLDLDRDVVRQYARGGLVHASKLLTWVTPRSLQTDVEDRDVLCLVCGGDQQSAVLSLLGGRVTVVEMSQGQLDSDRTSAEHYGYEVTTIHGDMRDLSIVDGDHLVLDAR